MLREINDKTLHAKNGLFLPYKSASFGIIAEPMAYPKKKIIPKDEMVNDEAQTRSNSSTQLFKEISSL